MRHAPNDLRQVYCAPATQWRNRMLALCVLFLIPPCLYSQGDEGLKARFLREAPAKWDAYKIRARKLQGEYRLTATELQPKLLKSVRVDTFKQSSSAAVYHRGVSQVLEGKAPPTTMPEMVWGQNAKYSFELTRGAPGKPWVAASLELGNKKALKNLGTPVEDWVLTLVTQQFRGGLPIPIGEAVRKRNSW